MTTSFFFYDLETSGFNPREDRIMQFAGIRTDMELQPIGDPVNVALSLTPDVVPSPDAILVTGITPQSTIAEGMTEAAFLRYFYDSIATPGTIFVGYNSVRFDDEFMRYLHYRNFYDPYEWQYVDGKSRWDLLDVVRMTRALRPDGIVWPVDHEGKPTNRLELLTQANGIVHTKAHDALSDVEALIAVAKLIKTHQPKLFSYLLDARNKKVVEQVATSGQPFVYSSGKYPNEYQKTAIVAAIAKHPKRQGALVFDLRYSPADFAELSSEELLAAWKRRDTTEGPILPIKTLQYNRCPAVAPLGVCSSETLQGLQIDMEQIERNFKALQTIDLAPKILDALATLEAEQDSRFAAQETDVDGQLYDGFFADGDKTRARALRAAAPDELSGFGELFNDHRLREMVPRYKARNYPGSLTNEEREWWDSFCRNRLLAGDTESKLARYFARLAELAQSEQDSNKQYLLEELQLYGQSIMPVAD